jgi:pyrimidine operon attenuation protein/uracil phosphoribosyltransferase
MEKERSLLLNNHQIQQRISRIAFQVFEDNFEEKEIIVIGIWNNGYLFAEKLVDAINSICSIKTSLFQLHIDKNNQVEKEVSISATREMMTGKSIILVDDVLNSGKTIIYAMKAILDIDTKKIRTALLVDRDHKRYPVMADFVGITLSTTLQEHVTVEFGADDNVWLS